METYLETTNNVYKEAAENPQEGLCCTTSPVWKLPELEIPSPMLKMNYGCGSTVHPRDLVNEPNVLYVGIGGGMELLQFSYFSRRNGAILGIDSVPEMINACQKNLKEAEKVNPWFDEKFVDIRKGDALSLPVEDSSVDVAAQNCLFNIFTKHDLSRALKEMYRVLKPNGRLVMSDPVSETPIPQKLQQDERLRALCLSGAMPVKDYIRILTETGFGTIEIRARRPYRILDPQHYDVEEVILIESLEVCAIKNPTPEDGPCVFTGKTAIYFGEEEYFDDDKGHILKQNQPLAVCDKTAKALQNLGREDIYISKSTYFYDGGGCC